MLFLSVPYTTNPIKFDRALSKIQYHNENIGIKSAWLLELHANLTTYIYSRYIIGKCDVEPLATNTPYGHFSQNPLFFEHSTNLAATNLKI
jgi:hypothetical protein